MISPARLFSSWMWTGVLKALETVAMTSGRALPPPYTLMGPAALTMGRTPIDLYSSAASLFNEFSWEEWMRRCYAMQPPLGNVPPSSPSPQSQPKSPTSVVPA